MEAQLYSTRASATRLPGKHWAVPYNSSLLPRSRARARCGVGAFAPLECFEGGEGETVFPLVVIKRMFHRVCGVPPHLLPRTASLCHAEEYFFQ